MAASIGYANLAGNLSTDAAAGDTVVRTENGGKLLLQTGSGSTALAIAANNNIGVGTTAPGNVRLSVLGSAPTGLPANTGATAVGNFRISMDFGTVNVAPNYPAWIQVHDSAAQGSNYALSLQPNGGYVGIGTLSPLSQLHVNGLIQARSATATDGYVSLVYGT